MPTKQMSEHEIRKIINAAIKESMPALESMVRSVLDERLRHLDVSDPVRQGTVRKLVEDAYADMDHTRRVYCHYEDYYELILYIIHDDEDRSRAFNEACDRSIKLEDELPDVYIEPHILHESEVDPYVIYDMRIVFVK